MVDGGVEDSDDSGFWLIDLVMLSGVFCVCDVELLLLDGNGLWVVFVLCVYEEVLFCSISCGFYCCGCFMLLLDWVMLGYLQVIDEMMSWCYGVLFMLGMVLMIMLEGISEFILSLGMYMILMLVLVVCVQCKLIELSLCSMLFVGQVFLLFNLVSDVMLLVCYYQQLYLQLGQGVGLQLDEIENLLYEYVQVLLGVGVVD